MDNGQKELKNFRDEIDGLDKIILVSLKQRFKLVEKVARIKMKLDLPLHQKARWESMLQSRLKLGSTLKLDDKFISSLFKLIHKESKRIQGHKIKKDKK
jgi:chorismate mutase